MTTDEAVTLLAILTCEQFAALDDGSMAVRVNLPGAAGVCAVPGEHLDALVAAGNLALVESDEVHVTAEGANALVTLGWVERGADGAARPTDGGRYWLSRAIRAQARRERGPRRAQERAELIAGCVFSRRK
jgi:hypothetical protein